MAMSRTMGSIYWDRQSLPVIIASGYSNQSRDEQTSTWPNGSGNSGWSRNAPPPPLSLQNNLEKHKPCTSSRNPNKIKPS
jgi:hypothetical protein